MGASESVPQFDIQDDDNDSFCRVPVSSAAPKTFRRPLDSSYVSPAEERQLKEGSRSACSTVETALYIPQDSFDDSLDVSSRSAEDDCWTTPVLQNIRALISPTQKMNAISFNNDDNAAADGINVHQDQSWESPTSVKDLPNVVNSLPSMPPLTSKSSLPCRRLDFSLQPSLVIEEQQRRQDDSKDLQNFLHEASKFEAESDLDAAISSLEEFLRLSQSTPTSFASDHSRATTLHKLGTLQWKCGRYFFSEHIFTDCIHLYERLLDEAALHHDDPGMYSLLAIELAHVFVSTGRVFISKGEGDAAMQCYNESVRLLSSIPKSASSPTTLITPARIFSQACVGAGRVLASQGRLKAALKRYKRALKNQLAPANDTAVADEDISALSIDEARVPLNDIAETLSHLGRLYEQRNDLTCALECHAKALAIYRSVLDPCAVDIGYASNNVGQLYLRLGHVVEAEQALTMAHQVFSFSLGMNHRNTADALLSLGQLYASQGRHKKALATYKRVLRAEPAVFGQLLAVTFHSIGCSYEATFRLDKALKYYKREFSVLNTTLPPCHLSRARLLHHMAKIAMQAVDSKGEFVLLEQAAYWLEEAAEIYDHNDGEDLLYEELLHLDASIEDTRLRMERQAHTLTTLQLI